MESLNVRNESTQIQDAIAYMNTLTGFEFDDYYNRLMLWLPLTTYGYKFKEELLAATIIRITALGKTY